YRIGNCQSGTWKKQWANNMIKADSVTSSCSTYDPPTQGNLAVATCPAGYQVTGGGYMISFWNPGSPSSSNAPDSSAPSGNGWAVIAGAKAGNSCFRAFAVCIK
ncbi:hypothetical protein, partial [Aeromonas hydrophila]|uniref:hypothetical protein n=1 Tax=Aeromonas hydrophila TaxID=644 RepID=UPI002254D84D